MTDLGGRGLQLVDRIAATWGCTRRADGTGKIVWFRVAVSAPFGSAL